MKIWIWIKAWSAVIQEGGQRLSWTAGFWFSPLLCWLGRWVDASTADMHIASEKNTALTGIGGLLVSDIWRKTGGQQSIHIIRRSLSILLPCMMHKRWGGPERRWRWHWELWKYKDEWISGRFNISFVPEDNEASENGVIAGENNGILYVLKLYTELSCDGKVGWGGEIVSVLLDIIADKV